MQLIPGTQLGSYEIGAQLGAGGMGEVYRARDPKLERDVAIKVLPSDFADNPERLARFEREAKSLAALNHPNIATVHGFEQEGDTHFLVMELADGEDLAERLKRGPISVDDAIPLFIQITEGLEAAHEKGIIHRDLKPANIMVSDKGRAKILDFGLAKEMESPAGIDSELSQSPTMTAAATMRGEIMGTAAYMSPEQARGKPVDRRADIWAFGVCLYEALTGARPFSGEDALSTLARVLDRTPDLDVFDGKLQGFRRLIGRCLEKDPERRYRDIGDVRLDLEEAHQQSSSTEPHAGNAGRPRLREAIAWAIALGLAVAALALFQRQTPSVAGTTTRTELLVPHLEPEEARSIAISPDGRTVVYFGREGAVRRLYRRHLEELEAEPIEGSEDTWGHQFFSPDGEWLVHMVQKEGYTLQKIPLAGGRPIDITTNALVWGGGDWHEDGTLLIGRDEDRLIHRIPAAGGDSLAVTTHSSEEAEHLDPHFLPNTSSFLFSVKHHDARYTIAIQDLGETEHRVFLEGRRPEYIDSGHLLFHRGAALWVVPFSAEEGRVLGEAVPLDDAPFVANSKIAFGSATSGNVVYTPRGSGIRGPLLWLDRDGRETSLGLDEGAYLQPRLSPDGRRIAFVVTDQVGGFGRRGFNSVLVLERGSLQPRLIETANVNNYAPLWGLDSQSLVFSSDDDVGNRTIFVSEDGQLRTTKVSNPDTIASLGWTGDGRLLFGQVSPDSGGDLMILDLESGKIESLLDDEDNTYYGSLSPNGRWVAYQKKTNDGRETLLVRSIDPEDGRSWPIAEGLFPIWTGANGGELFFLRDDQLMSIAIDQQPPFVRSDPRLVIRGPYFEAPLYARPYDYDPETDRFLVVKHRVGPRALVVVQGLQHEVEG